MKFKRIIAAISAAALMATPAYAKTMEFTIDSETAYVSDGSITPIALDTRPMIMENRTMVPVRVIAEEFGAEVMWNETDRTVSIKKDGIDILLTVNNKTAYVNGEEKLLDMPPVIDDNRTLIPLRFISESLGMYVEYVASTRQIIITDKEPVMNVNGKNVYLDDFKFYSYALGQNLSNSEELSPLVNEFLYTSVFSSLSEYDGTYTGDTPEIKEEVADVMNQYGDESYSEFLYSVGARNLQNEILAQIYMNKTSAELQNTISDNDINEFYQSNYICAKHILVSDETLAEEILAKIVGGEDFDKLMNEYSEDPGLASYPDGYVFTTGEMVQEFEDTAFAIEAGTVSDVVKTDYGYHILKREALPEIDDSTRYYITRFLLSSLSEQFFNLALNSAPVEMHMTDEEIIEAIK